MDRRISSSDETLYQFVINLEDLERTLDKYNSGQSFCLSGCSGLNPGYRYHVMVDSRKIESFERCSSSV